MTNHKYLGVKNNYPKSRSAAFEAFEALANLGPFGFMTSTIIFSRAWPLRLGKSKGIVSPVFNGIAKSSQSQ
jgi:hypothetical protein